MVICECWCVPCQCFDFYLWNKCLMRCCGIDDRHVIFFLLFSLLFACLSSLHVNMNRFYIFLLTYIFFFSFLFYCFIIYSYFVKKIRNNNKSNKIKKSKINYNKEEHIYIIVSCWLVLNFRNWHVFIQLFCVCIHKTIS